MAHELETRRWGWGVLLVSVTTLVCCALPILLVSLGMGAIWATIYANFAAVGFVAENKLWFFSGCAVLLVCHKERAELYQEQFHSCSLTVTIEPD